MLASSVAFPSNVPITRRKPAFRRIKLSQMVTSTVGCSLQVMPAGPILRLRGPASVIMAPAVTDQGKKTLIRAHSTGWNPCRSGHCFGLAVPVSMRYVLPCAQHDPRCVARGTLSKGRPGPGRPPCVTRRVSTSDACMHARCGFAAESQKAWNVPCCWHSMRIALCDVISSLSVVAVTDK
jgi:hypothetical protein